MAEIITLDSDSESIRHLCVADPRLAALISRIGPISYSKHDEDPYGFLVHEILEQMLSVKAAAKIHSRLLDLCGGEISLDRISKLSASEIQAVGTSPQKARYIKNLTDAVDSGDLDFHALEAMDDCEVINSLVRIKGVGNWTAKMYLIFVLDRQDILPYEDGAFLQAYKWLYATTDTTKPAIEATCRAWKPYSSIAARYLYRALDSGFTKPAKKTD